MMQRIIQEKAEPAMAEWQDAGRIFKLGLKLTGAILIYSLPALIIMMLGYFSMMAPAFIEAFSNPRAATDVTSLTGISVLGMFGGMALFGIGFILFVPLCLVMPPM